jgi:trehalose utilization protein
MPATMEIEMERINVTVWNEGRHEKVHEEVKKIYPDGIHSVLSKFLTDQGFNVRTATLDDPENGLPKSVLETTDVLTWWGHMAHDEISDDLVERIRWRVLHGMGLIVLHSGHHSKIFKRLMGTTCSLRWREADERVRVWLVAPSHPIASGLPEYFEIPNDEMYGEHFDIPAPDDLVFINWYQGGEVFRSGCCYNRGNGKIFYFSPGHETFPVYYQNEIQHVITNAVRWAAPVSGPPFVYSESITLQIEKPLEKLNH